MPNSADVILVDWDHTLHDAAATFFAALRAVLARRGISIDEQMYRAAYDPDYRTLYARLGLPAGEVDAASAEWRDMVGQQEPRLLSGAREGLEALRDAGLVLGVVTAAERELAVRQMDRSGVGWLNVLVAGGEAGAARPDPAPLRLALQRLGGISPDAAAYVGDTPADVVMARAAGTWAVGIGSFASDEASLRVAGADETAASFGEWAARRLARGW